MKPISLVVFVLAFLIAACGAPTSAEYGESGTQYRLQEVASETRDGVSLTMYYEGSAERFVGTMTNTTNAAIADVRVEVHLSNGIELGPSPLVALAAKEKVSVELAASGQKFSTWSAHVEIGQGEH